MTNRLFGLCRALLAVAFIAPLAVSGTASADALRMLIENQSTETLYFDSETSVENHPDTIAPATTSADIRAEGANKGSVGEITYMNNSAKATSTCFATLEFSWTFNSGSGNCDDKNFTIVNTGKCTLARADTCTGSDNCNCRFTFNSGN